MHLSWRDLIILRCLIHLTEELGEPPSQRALGRCLNALIERERIPEVFGLPIIPDNASKSVTRLRKLGLIEPDAPLTATPTGKLLNAQLPDAWNRLPTYVPLDDDGKPDFDRARFI